MPLLIEQIFTEYLSRFWIYVNPWVYNSEKEKLSSYFF